MRPQDLAAALEDLAGRMNRAGIPATTDPRNVNPPAAWVTLGRGEFTVLCGDLDATATVLLVAPDNGMPTALRILGDMLGTLAGEVAVPSGPVEPDTTVLPGTPTGLPS